MVYEVTVLNTTIDNGTVGTGTGDFWKIPDYGYYTSPSIYWGSPTIYMYQITCPRCKKMNWMQLDMITPCTKCKAQLKAVTKQADYEIPIKTEGE